VALVVQAVPRILAMPGTVAPAVGLRPLSALSPPLVVAAGAVVQPYLARLVLVVLEDLLSEA
jgi:hypothetical protein